MSEQPADPPSPSRAGRRSFVRGVVMGCVAWAAGLALLNARQEYAAVGVLVAANFAALVIGALNEDRGRRSGFFSGFLVLEVTLVGLYMLLQPLCQKL